ncbi:uncharacterized protein [Apostichopus japonicus]|uniref:uncharacterized protein isoform X2 n=1 Tax=Stichopus japonicus TaxID=307972 RepID=UPI003AB14EB9
MMLLAVLVTALSVAVLPSESKVLGLWDYHSTIANMFSQSCGTYVQNPTGLDQLKKELDQCYKAKSIPEPGIAELTGVPVGLEETFPDEYLYASSYRDDFSTPQRGRLNLIKDGELGLNGAWCSEINNEMQFFQVDLGASHAITGIETQGDHNELNWVRTYTLEVSMDGSHWSCVFGSDGRVKVFNANIDSDTIVVNVMNPFIRTRYIRIVPKSWTNHICMRVELYVTEIVPRDPEDPEEVTDFETQVLGVNPKQPEALVVKSFSANQVNAGMLPEQWSEKSRAPLKSISFEHLKLQPELYEVEPAGVVGQPLDPNLKVDPLIISGGGPIVDYVAPSEGGVEGQPLDPNLKVEPLIISGGGPIVDYVAPSLGDFLQIPREVSTFGGVEPIENFDYEWHPLTFDRNIYLEFSFGYAVHIRGFSTTGRPGFEEWVSEYKIMYLNPYTNQWTWLRDGEVMEDLRIVGNDDDSSPRDHIYSPAIFTSRLRIFMLDWHSKPAMWIRLYMGTELREAPQVVTGPIYDGNVIRWAWDALSSGEGETQEVYFSRALTLSGFSLDEESTISTYKLQYLSGENQWTEIEYDETVIFSTGETVQLDFISCEGLRVEVTSWQDEASFFGVFYLQIEEAVSVVDESPAVEDIRELANHYLHFRWEESDPIDQSGVLFSLSELQEVTRIESKGCNGAGLSEYQLECRHHYAKSGSQHTFAGNTNDVDIVEHMLNLDCKYIVFKPSQYDQSICAEIFIYSSQELIGSTASIFSPGSKGGSFQGEWTLAAHGESPYLEFVFDRHVTPTQITLEAKDGNQVQSFELERSYDGESFELVMDGDNGVKTFTFGSASFDATFEIKGLRILPIVQTTLDVVSFSYSVDFVSEHHVEVSVQQASGEPDQPADPRAVISGNYAHSETVSGQTLGIIFEKAETVHRFTMGSAVANSKIISFQLFFKASPEDTDYVSVTVDDQVTFAGNGVSVDLGGLKYAEIQVLITEAEGDGVKFEYELEISGNVKYSVTTAIQEAKENAGV